MNRLPLAARLSHGLGTLLVTALLAACASPSPGGMPIHARVPPKSILVLPPINDSVEVRAPASFMSSVTAPLAERGYYVFPVVVIEELMRANGLPTATEMHQVPLAKLVEIIGPDAVLYPRITDYGRRFQLVNSSAVAEIQARLVDARTGEEIWSGAARVTDDSGSGYSGGGLAGAILGAIVEHAVASSLESATDSDAALGLMQRANYQMFSLGGNRLPFGARHPSYAAPKGGPPGTGS